MRLGQLPLAGLLAQPAQTEVALSCQTEALRKGGGEIYRRA